jgi:hypothetical protein
MGGVDSRGTGNRSALASATPLIAPSTTNDIKPTEFPWVLVPKVILWSHHCQRLLRSLTENTASLTANEFGDSIGYWNSGGAVGSWAWGDRSPLTLGG